MTTDKDLDYYYANNINANDYLDLIQPEISGGKITREQIDAIQQLPHREAITISGLRQDTFEYFIVQYGDRFKAIYFWKCPRIEDLTALEQLKDIQYVLFFWNQKVTRLWSLAKNPKLKGLLLYDFMHLHALDDMAHAPSLEQFDIGNSPFSTRTLTLKSLVPLAALKTLKSLTLSVGKIEDNDLTPLLRMKQLQRFAFPPSLFTTEQVAYLTARLKNVQSEHLQPYRLLENPIGDKDCLVIGKGKPFLNSQKDAARLEKYVQKFAALVTQYEQDAAC